MTSVVLATLGLLSSAAPAHATPAEDDVETLDLLTIVIESLEDDNASYEDAVDDLEASGAWIPAAGGFLLTSRDATGLAVMWLALEADETELLRLANDTIAAERDSIVFGGDDQESLTNVQSTDLTNASVLQVIDRRGLAIPDLARTVMSVNPRPGSGGTRPRPALFDDAIREIATLIANPTTDATSSEAATSSSENAPTGSALPTVALAAVGLAAVVMSMFFFRRRRREDQLEDLAFTDGLTGLNNRRRLDSDVSAAKESAGRPTAMLMIDVDHFKAFNDRHGHRAGDEALRRVGAAISAALRTGDIAYRYGGEEFCVMLQDTTDEVAAHIAERLRESIAASPIELDDGSQHSVTASIGLATGQAGMLDDLITTADQAMYAAKQAGRNQLAIA